MFKLSHQVEHDFIEHSHPPVMQRDLPSQGTERLVAGVPAGDSTVFEALVKCLEEPFFLLYILHTPRGEGEPGRYQSPELSRDEAATFLKRFSAYLGQDARHDIWARSQQSNGTVVWDRHNLIYAYGPLSAYESALLGLGFMKGEPSIPSPHEHYYREEFDQDAAAVLSHFEWYRSELRPEDEQ